MKQQLWFVFLIWSLIWFNLEQIYQRFVSIWKSNQGSISCQCFQLMNSLENCISRVEISIFSKYSYELIWKYIIYMYIYMNEIEAEDLISQTERENDKLVVHERVREKKTRTTFCLFLISDTFVVMNGVTFERNYVSSFIRSYLNTSSSSILHSLRRTIYFIIRSFISCYCWRSRSRLYEMSCCRSVPVMESSRRTYDVCIVQSSRIMLNNINA